MFRWMGSLTAGLLAVLVCLGMGCGVYPTENHRTINDLSYDAGKQLSTSSDPNVAQTGKDVAANSQVLADTLLGWPINRVKYDAALAAKVRADTIKEFEDNQPWYKKLAGVIMPVLSVLLVGGTMAARFFPATAPIVAVASPIVSALMAIKQKADAHPQDSIHIDDIQAEISQLANDPKAGPLVTSLLKKIHMDQVIHAPEAPDVHPSAATESTPIPPPAA